jgi:DNA polymerase-3 subunit chi
MTRIDFYVLKETSRSDRFGLTCRLAERIYNSPDPDKRDAATDAASNARRAAPRVLIYCPDTRQARDLDRLLWSFREASFLPHGLVGETDPALTPILISSDGNPEHEDQVLINLGTNPEPPPFFSRFVRLCEPLDHAPEVRQAGRRRYAYYRDCGYPLEHHSIG